MPFRSGDRWSRKTEQISILSEIRSSDPAYLPQRSWQNHFVTELKLSITVVLFNCFQLLVHNKPPTKPQWHQSLAQSCAARWPQQADLPPPSASPMPAPSQSHPPVRRTPPTPLCPPSLTSPPSSPHQKIHPRPRMDRTLPRRQNRHNRHIHLRSQRPRRRRIRRTPHRIPRSIP
jgi:hypothetical protein